MCWIVHLIIFGPDDLLVDLSSDSIALLYATLLVFHLPTDNGSKLGRNEPVSRWIGFPRE